MTRDKAAKPGPLRGVDREGCGMTSPELPRDMRGRPVGERLYTSPMTAGFGVRVAHEVTDEAFAAGRAAGRGECEALCGVMFVPAPLVAPPGRPCPACLGILAAARRAAASSRRPGQRRVGLLRRLVPLRRGRRARTGKDIPR